MPAQGYIYHELDLLSWKEGKVLIKYLDMKSFSTKEDSKSKH